MDERQKLGKQVEEICRTMTTFKGRISKVEHTAREMQEEIECIEVEQNEQRLDSNFNGSVKTSCDVSSYFNDKVEKLQDQLNMALVNVEDLHNDVKATGAAVNDLQIVATSEGKGEVYRALTPNGNSEIASTGSSSEIRKIKAQMASVSTTSPAYRLHLSIRTFRNLH